VLLCLTGQLPIVHTYLTTPLFNQIGVLCGTLCNWQYDAISTHLRWGRAQCQARFAKLLREYKQSHPDISIATPTITATATAALSDSINTVPANVDFAKAASLLSAPTPQLFNNNNTVTTATLPTQRLPVPQFTPEKVSAFVLR